MEGTIDTKAPNEETIREVEALVSLRTLYREGKDYQAADRMRDQLLALGVTVGDTPEGTVWSWITESVPIVSPPVSSEPSARKLRYKRKNEMRRAKKPRAQLLAEWLVERVGLKQLQAGGVIDVAGGNGKLMYELCVVRGIPCTVVDPRPLSLSPYTTSLLLKRCREWAATQGMDLTCSCQAHSCGAHRDNQLPVGFALNDVLGSELCPTARQGLQSYLSHIGMHHLQQPFTPTFGVAGGAGEHVLAQAACIVGLHPDEATDAVVDVALVY
eukprot:Ihof_evm3s904 gene=Ihof_evmTU3s904